MKTWQQALNKNNTDRSYVDLTRPLKQNLGQHWCPNILTVSFQIYGTFQKLLIATCFYLISYDNWIEFPSLARRSFGKSAPSLVAFEQTSRHLFCHLFQTQYIVSANPIGLAHRADPMDSVVSYTIRSNRLRRAWRLVYSDIWLKSSRDILFQRKPSPLRRFLYQ